VRRDITKECEESLNIWENLSDDDDEIVAEDTASFQRTLGDLCGICGRVDLQLRAYALASLDRSRNFESLCDLSRVWCSGVGVVCESANYLKRAERLLEEISDDAMLEKRKSNFMIEQCNHLLQSTNSEQRVQDEVSELLSRLMNRVMTCVDNNHDDELLRSRCHTYRSAAILRDRRSSSVAIQRAFEEARVALRLHGKASLETSSNWTQKVEQCAEALLTCGKMQEHAGNASQASAYYKSGFDMAQRANSAPLRRVFSRALASLSAARGDEKAKTLLEDCNVLEKYDVDGKDDDNVAANVSIQKRETLQQDIVRGDVCFEWEEASRLPFVRVESKHLRSALSHYLTALSSLDDLVLFLKRWGNESYVVFERITHGFECENFNIITLSCFHITSDTHSYR
jgi:hypothetical protein